MAQEAVNEVINGQIVPPLDQWAGAVLIAAALVVGYASRWIQRAAPAWFFRLHGGGAQARR